MTYFMTYFMIDSRINKHHQIILLKLKFFKHIILNQILPIFSTNKVWNGPATWSILTSHYAWGPETTYNGFPNTHGLAFGWESRVHTITRSRLLAHVWSGPECVLLTLFLSNVIFLIVFQPWTGRSPNPSFPQFILSLFNLNCIDTL
jgi:hypothetical protein